ncbi:FAD-binding protein [Streptomyces sp. NBC_01795]|uniref:FAD-binding oxidoreductase n=1 Tax=unclassified Streptomyces TaxID=2593676 RepID=UPI002DDBE76A|nr:MULTISPECIES: FAD-linked oxidase C-terminal domain-containing protein [unclassified Streptomyces]WSA95942.1 FAD-binding protein [Streptomyces sp. NBC_01795]WSB80357.1 FAD-binding protein [Streptomyces sp. NBC_01775]
MTTAGVREALTAALPDSNLITDPDVLAALSADDAEWAEAGSPLAALRAASTEEVRAAVRACAALRVPVVTRGAGTGLSGGANATDGCLVLDLSRMNRILEIDEDNLLAVVQPGVVNNDLKAAVAERGLWYPPDPASAPWSTIGGNVATNAGGLCCLKYGVTRDYVLGLEAVMGGPAGEYGTAVRVGRRTTKGVSGYDLTGLLVGSEGTLGVLTEITVRLRPALREPPHTVVGAFDSLVAAGEAVALCTRRGLRPAALELLDRACMEAVEDWKHLGIEAGAAALLLARVDDPGQAGTDEAAAVAHAFSEAGALWAERSTDEIEAEALFEVRRLAYPALERLGPVLTEDVCVPRSAVPAMLARTEEIGKRHGVRVATIAHAGDGNLHPLLITPPGDDAARRAAQAAFEELLTEAVALGGTVTGEHGVGLLKRGGMRSELGPEVCAVQQALKDTLDPLGLFNPGKVVGGAAEPEPGASTR